MEKFEELKAKCDELGIKYHHKAGVKKLTELLEAHEVAPEASPAVVVASAEEEATEVVVEVKETERGVELKAQPMKVSDAAKITVKDGNTRTFMHKGVLWIKKYNSRGDAISCRPVLYT